jgi:tetratricopeptide (TPR) repeat protein
LNNYRKNKKEGTLGYFGLTDWWESNFTEDEREYILRMFQPFGSGSNSLLEGEIISTSQTVVSLLYSLSGWFRKKENRTIAYRFIEKAEELVDETTEVLDLHFLYQHKLELYYRNRDNDEFALDEAIKACNQQIELAPKAKVAFHKQDKNFPLPSHRGFKQLAIIEEKRNNFSKAIEICEKALKQEWNGDWGKRILRCQKKIKNQMQKK